MDLFVPGPAGRLEAVLWTPRGPGGAELAPRAAAVVCHPHPKGGGTLHNNVVFRIARGLQKAGLAVLRFNFRGVEASEGVHDGNGAEEEDARAALDWLAQRFPGLELWGGGFSFGARTMLALAAREPRIARLLCVALPVSAFDCSAILAVRVPTRLIMAGNDQYGTLADLRARFPVLPTDVEVDEIPGVDHFFKGKTLELEERVRSYALKALEIRR